MERRFFLVGIFLFVFAFNMALAQNQTGEAARSVVLESVDEDIVDDEVLTPVKGDASSSVSAQGAQKKSDAAGELDIDKLLSGDDEEDLLAEEKSSVSENAPAADSASADSLMKSAETAPDSQAVPKYGNRGKNERRPQTAEAGKKDTVDLGPVVIEDGRSINFAHNLSEYRSPKMAMLLSFLLPGLGQAYSKSYIKAGAFGAAEIASIGTAVYFSSKGKSKKQEAYKHADKYFSVDSLGKFYDGMEPKFTAVERDLPFDTAFYNAAGRKESYFYESIKGEYFTPGWIDVYPDIDALVNGSGDTPLEWLFGVSNYQKTYNSIMKESKSKYDAVNYTLYVVLLNHIVSAIDAGFTAKAYNSNLLGKDNSVWERISLEQQYVFSGSEMSPGAMLKIKF
ncbi:MAG: hypothetical protein LBB56_00660 [Chitinispirillales bacterium]|jgi:hypothetical protein|nr:hypothetical protein [Chitinispirillales bacterium]